MKKRERNTVFQVATTRTFKSENPSPGKQTWDLAGTVNVLAADAEDAIKRVREYYDREDKDDDALKRRTAFVFGSIIERDTLAIV